jgi:hypothetical protein
LIASYGARFSAYAPQAAWRDDDHVDVAFSARGLRLQGSVEITAHSFVLRLPVPLLLRPFKALAIARIDSEAARVIAQFSARPPDA